MLHHKFIKVGKLYWLMYCGRPVQKKLLEKKERTDRKDIVNLNFDHIATDSSNVFETKQELLNSL